MGKEYTRDITIFGNIPLEGKIIFFDDFSGPLKWLESGTGGDTFFELDPTIAFTGLQSLFLQTRTTGAAEDDEIIATRSTHLLPSKTVAFLSRIISYDLGDLKFLFIKIYFYSGTNQYITSIRYTPSTQEWHFLNSSNTYSLLALTYPYIVTNTFHRLALLVNFSTNYYHSFQFNDQSIDLSSYPLRSIVSAGDSRLQTIIHAVATAGAPFSFNIDQITLHEI